MDILRAKKPLAGYVGRELLQPTIQTNLTRVYNKSCHDMSELKDNSIQCVVTSPPYWGLRKYAGEQDLIWGGDKECRHEWGEQIISKPNDSNRGTMEWSTGGNPAAKVEGQKVDQGQYCKVCGAWRGGYGLEPTPELYVQHSVEILREIKRVLRPDGVCFWNCGDSYFSQPGNGRGGGEKLDGGIPHYSSSRREGNLKPKDLCLIPFRVAIAAQSDGWWVRSDIIWLKNNPMPESVRDRPTESHEHILMLTKSATYYWDQEAVREPSLTDTETKTRGGFGSFDGKNNTQELAHAADLGHAWQYQSTRNLRSVWTFPTQSYGGAHFATFPKKLPETCILASTSEAGCCSKCGKPWARIVSKPEAPHDGKTDAKEVDPQSNTRRISLLRQAARERGEEYHSEVKTLGFKPSCTCNASAVPCTVLDPFAGSGCTLEVATKLGRRSIGYEISSEYIPLIVERVSQQGLV